MDHLTDINEGTGQNERNGWKVYALSIDWRLTLELDQGIDTNTVRLIIFVDLDSQGVQPTMTDLMGTANQHSGQTRDLSNKSRFFIIKDKVYNISTVQNDTFHTSGFERLKLPLQFDGTDGTDYDKNPVFISLASDSSVNFPVIAKFNCLTRYIDT